MQQGRISSDPALLFENHMLVAPTHTPYQITCWIARVAVPMLRVHMAIFKANSPRFVGSIGS